MASDSRNFLKGITSGYAFTISSLFISLFMVPFSLKYLDKSEYAIYAIASDLLAWLSVANLGITSVFGNKAGHLLGSKSTDELNVLTSTTFYTQLATSLIIMGVGTAVILNPEFIFPSSGAIGINREGLLFLLILSYLITYILQPFNVLLVADKQIHVDNYLKFATLALRTSLNVILLIKGYKVLAFAISNIVATILISGVTIYRVRKTLPNIEIRFKFWDKNQIYFLFKMGFWFTIGGIAGILIFRVDSYLIGKFITLGIVTSFVITSKLYQIADTFHQQLFNTTRPYFAQTFGKGDNGKLKNLYDSTFYLSYLFSVILGAGVFFFNKWFIGIWVGKEYFIGDTINFLLCVNFILQASVLPNRILLATSFYKIELHNFTRVFEGAAKLILGIFLIVRFDIIGLLIASIFASIIFSNSILNYLTTAFFRESFLKKIMPFFWIPFLPIVIYLDSYSIQILLLLTIIISGLFIVYIKLDGFKNLKTIFNK